MMKSRLEALSREFVGKHTLMLIAGLMVLYHNTRHRMVIVFGKCTGSQSSTTALPVFTNSFFPFYWL